jgi:hypothetical protein
MGYREIPVGTETCLGCDGVVEEGTAICPACGSPIDISHFAELELKLKPHLRQARMALAVASSIFGSCLLLLMMLQVRGPTLWTAALGTLLFGGCCAWSIWRPLGASVTALAVFCALQVAVVAHGHLWMLFQGSIIVMLKVVLLVLLVGGVQAGLRLRDLRRQTRPRDRPIAAAVVAATLTAGIALGLWARREEARAYQYQYDAVYDDAPDTLEAPVTPEAPEPATTE